MYAMSRVDDAIIIVMMSGSGDVVIGCADANGVVYLTAGYTMVITSSGYRLFRLQSFFGILPEGYDEPCVSLCSFILQSIYDNAEYLTGVGTVTPEMLEALPVQIEQAQEQLAARFTAQDTALTAALNMLNPPRFAFVDEEGKCCCEWYYYHHGEKPADPPQQPPENPQSPPNQPENPGQPEQPGTGNPGQPEQPSDDPGVIAPDPDPSPGTFTANLNTSSTWNVVGTFAPGDIVTITAPSRPGHTFLGWTSPSHPGIVADSTNPSTTFIMPNADVYIAASWFVHVGNFSVAVQDPNVGWSLTGTNSDMTVTAGNPVTITLGSPDPSGLIFIRWEATGVTLANPYSRDISFTMPANDVVLTATFGII
jgi:uncharacterized repeat protein (TIGR02543 family)